MNGTSILLLAFFFVAGYFIYPVILPSLQDNGYGIVENTADDSGDAVDLEPVTSSRIVDEATTPIEEVDGEDVEFGAPLDEDLDSGLGVLIDPVEEEKAKLMAELEATSGIENNAEEIGDSKTLQTLETPSTPVEPIEPVTPEPVIVALTEEQAIKIMKESIRANSINEFEFSQVNSWELAEKEIVRGISYDIGLVSFTARTIFGDQTLEAKALFQDSKLVRWVWATTHNEMK